MASPSVRYCHGYYYGGSIVDLTYSGLCSFLIDWMLEGIFRIPWGIFTLFNTNH